MFGKRALSLSVIGLVVGTLAGCGGDGDDATTASGSTTTTADNGPVSIDVGAAKPITFDAGTTPKIAFFAAAGNAYQEAYKTEVKRLVGEGADITYFDSKFDPTTQLKQLQNALQSKKYNAWIVENYGGEITCAILSKQAPAAGIVVSQITNPTCDQSSKPAGDEFWTPGTLNTIGGQATPTYATSWVREAKKMFGPGKHTVAALNGPQLVASTVNFNNAMKANGVKPVVNVNSNYTTPDGLAKMQNVLRANPDIDILLSIYGDSTLGAIKAIEAAGKTGKIKVFDIGGAKTTVEQIEAGNQVMSVPYFPVTQTQVSVQRLTEAFAGKKVPRYEDAFADGTVDDPFAITKATAADFTPQY